ncbi:ISSfl2 ORF [Shigella sonnei]|nr:ISSfl2 ORF [Shigella sonnei]
MTNYVNCKNSEGSGNYRKFGNDSNLLIVFYVQIMPDDFVMQLHRF